MEQISCALKQAETGTSVPEVTRRMGISEQTFYRWKKLDAGLGVDRSLVRYVSVKPDQAPLRLRIHDLARTRMRYGYFGINTMLRRGGWLANHKRVSRRY